MGSRHLLAGALSAALVFAGCARDSTVTVLATFQATDKQAVADQYHLIPNVSYPATLRWTARTNSVGEVFRYVLDATVKVSSSGAGENLRCVAVIPAQMMPEVHAHVMDSTEFRTSCGPKSTIMIAGRVVTGNSDPETKERINLSGFVIEALLFDPVIKKRIGRFSARVDLTQI